MKQQDLAKHHGQTIPELEAEVQKLELEFVETRMKQNLGQIKNLHASKSLRQDIARLKTIIRHKQLVETQEKPKSTQAKPTSPINKTKTTKTNTTTKPTKKTTTKKTTQK